jgi:hypothetical protein
MKLHRCRQVYAANHGGRRVVGIDPQERARVRIGRGAFEVVDGMGALDFDVVGDEVGVEIVPARVPGLIVLANGSIVLGRAKDKATEL